MFVVPMRALLVTMISLAWVAPVAAAPSGKCTIAIKGDGPVAKACKEGGLKKANTVMKAMQKVGKEKGLKLDCDDCHKDIAADNFALTKNAQESFKKLLAVQPAAAPAKK